MYSHVICRVSLHDRVQNDFWNSFNLKTSSMNYSAPFFVHHNYYHHQNLLIIPSKYFFKSMWIFSSIFPTSIFGHVTIQVSNNSLTSFPTSIPTSFQSQQPWCYQNLFFKCNWDSIMYLSWNSSKSSHCSWGKSLQISMISGSFLTPLHHLLLLFPILAHPATLSFFFPVHGRLLTVAGFLPLNASLICCFLKFILTLRN